MRLFSIGFILSCLVVFVAVGSVVAAYPQPAQTITRAQADYLTPENTYYAIRSCLAAENLEWCDETLTGESLQRDIELFAKAGIDRRQIFALQKNVRESFVAGKHQYNDAVVLLVEDHGVNGSVTVLPLTFVQENGKWKVTNKYSADEQVNKYLYHVPPLFDGKGQKSDDVNLFLGFEQPFQAQTDLPPGTANYTVHVYYGKTVVPAAFKAELNRQDVGNLFSPKPFSDEEVDIPLQQGRNVLVLSIEGAMEDGRKAKDTDRFVFVVP